ncbi:MULTISPECIES: hypothetical protein [Halomonas]|uniref:hypothetical protein n=1 Tax=Halomonas TaxID=2745 RepID=UPI002015EE8F|nr:MULTISPECIES: hypothetical protein [Halomonas]
MPARTQHDDAKAPAAMSRRRPARWWLAGLLVGCLLPAGLAQGETLRQAERLVQVCILAPALIRASSRLQARRRARRAWPLRVLGRPGARGRLPLPPSPRRRLATAAHDVLTRRGPPCVGTLNP